MSDSDYIANDPRCLKLYPDYMTKLESVEFWCTGVIYTIVGCIGLVANLISIFNLATDKKLLKDTFNKLLLSLAIFDVIFICSSLPIHSFEAFGFFHGNRVT